jgi:hypothetical protein
MVADGAKGPDEKAFGKSFESIQKLGDAGKWSDEKKSLLKLLNETGDQPFVHSRRTELVDELRRAAIRTAVPQPEPATMTDGRLLAWDRHNGDLSITYDAGKWKDFKTIGRLAVHPAAFEGPVTVKVDGDDFRWTGGLMFEIAIGIHDDEVVLVALGARKDTGNNSYFPAVTEIVEVSGGHRNVLAKEARAPNAGKHFDVEIVVGTTEIAVNSGGSRLCQAKLPEKFHGQVGFTNEPYLKHVSLRGRASPAWLQGKLDAVTHDAEEKFLAKWKVDDDLPPWLKSGASPANPAAAGAPTDAKDKPDESLPWPVTEEQGKLYASLETDFGEGHPEKVLQRIAKLPPDALPSDLKEYLFLEALARLGALSRFGERLDAFCARNPAFADGLYLHARMQIERDALDDAARELTALHGKLGDPALVAVDLVHVQLMRAQPEEAQKVLREARAEGATSPEFDELDEMVVHILRGPNFPKRFEQKSPHFTLVTDIDNDTARASLKWLEESYAICSKVFGASDATARPFPVYLFSGRASYIEYAGKTTKLAHSTAGMYSRLFKHLLVWNQSEHDETTRTLRHEATHQYLDLLGYRVPVWFNEGLAVYVELIASGSKADLKGGAVDRVMVDSLVRNHELIHLKDLIAITPDDFYGHAQVTYPEAWALVHYLRHGEAPGGAAPASGEISPREVNARLMAALQERVAPHEVVKRAFAGVDLARFEARFLEHLDELRAEADKR